MSSFQIYTIIFNILAWGVLPIFFLFFVFGAMGGSKQEEHQEEEKGYEEDTSQESCFVSSSRSHSITRPSNSNEYLLRRERDPDELASTLYTFAVAGAMTGAFSSSSDSEDKNQTDNNQSVSEYFGENRTQSDSYSNGNSDYGSGYSSYSSDFGGSDYSSSDCGSYSGGCD